MLLYRMFEVIKAFLTFAVHMLYTFVLSISVNVSERGCDSGGGIGDGIGDGGDGDGGGDM